MGHAEFIFYIGAFLFIVIVTYYALRRHLMWIQDKLLNIETKLDAMRPEPTEREKELDRNLREHSDARRN